MIEEPPYDDVGAAFAAAVRRLRESRGWSQAELARLMAVRGVPEATQVLVSRIEANKRDVRLNEARALALSFRMSIEEMVARSEAVMWLAVDHREARDAYVRFRTAVVRVAEWQARLKDVVKTARPHAQNDRTGAHLVLNVENYIAMDLAAETAELVEATRQAIAQNETSRGGRFLNSRNRSRGMRGRVGNESQRAYEDDGVDSEAP